MYNLKNETKYNSNIKFLIFYFNLFHFGIIIFKIMMVYSYILYVQYAIKCNPHLKSDFQFVILLFQQLIYQIVMIHDYTTYIQSKTKNGIPWQKLFHKLKPSINCTWATKKIILILFYIPAKMPMTHLKLTFFNMWIYRILYSLINAKDIQTLLQRWP